MSLERALRILGSVSIFALGLAGCEVNIDDDGDDEVASCFYLCTNDDAICTSDINLSVQECGEVAEDDCGGEPVEQKYISGCDCPFNGARGECTPSDGVPEWVE